MQKEQYIFVNGWSFNDLIWRSFIDQLQLECEPIIVSAANLQDPLGLLERTQMHIEQAFEQGKRVTLVGWSLGTLVALRLASEYKSTIRRLILFSATSTFIKRETSSTGWDERIVTRMQRRIAKNKNDVLANFDRLLFASDEEVCDLRFGEESDASESLVHGLQYLKDEDVRSILQEVVQPTLLIHGDQDEVCPLLGIDEIYERVSGDVEKVVIKGTAHVPFIMNESRCIEEIREFVNKTSI